MKHRVSNHNRAPAVVIAVYTMRHVALEGARVTLKPIARINGRIVALHYDRRLHAFRGDHVRLGYYQAHVEAKGLASEEREIQVGSAGFHETFILGPKGQPFYYRGKVRVPFEPRYDLIAVALIPDPSAREEDRLLADARALGLKPESVDESVRRDNVRVFRFVRRLSEAKKEGIEARLSGHRVVSRVGPVIHFHRKSVSFLTSDLVVKFKGQVRAREVPGFAKRFNLKVLRPIPYASNAFQMRGRRPAYDLLETCDAIVKTGLAEYAEPDLVTTAVLDFTPNDSLFGQQPHHPIINSAGAWDMGLGANTVTVAVVDDGCDIMHPDFQNPPTLGWTKISNPFDFTKMNANPYAEEHGTKSCGLACAVTNNSIGVAGLASGCRLMPIGYPSPGTDTAYSDAYVWVAGFDPKSITPGFPAAISPGADVINSSFGLYQMALSGIMKDALDFITTYGRNGKGCVVVFSVGDDYCDFTNCSATEGARQWAANEKTIAVSASCISPPDAAEIKVCSSNFGPRVDVCAPAGGPAGGPETRTVSTTKVGAGTLAGSPTGDSYDYASFGQTSAAAPQVAGIAALMLSVSPNLTWMEVRQILRDTAVKIDAGNTDPIGRYNTSGHSQWYGYGRVDAQAAVQAASEYMVSRDMVVRDSTPDTGTVPSTPRKKETSKV